VLSSRSILGGRILSGDLDGEGDGSDEGRVGRVEPRAQGVAPGELMGLDLEGNMLRESGISGWVVGLGGREVSRLIGGLRSKPCDEGRRLLRHESSHQCEDLRISFFLFYSRIGCLARFSRLLSLALSLCTQPYIPLTFSLLSPPFLLSSTS